MYLAGSHSEVGGFAGFFGLKASGYDDPILVSQTKGLGPKLQVTCNLTVAKLALSPKTVLNATANCTICTLLSIINTSQGHCSGHLNFVNDLLSRACAYVIEDVEVLDIL